MRYQVMARIGASSDAWEYYPYWAPVREKAAAERLAGYAAQSGHEAVILQSVTSEMLESLGRRIVEQQETELLPVLRYLPTSPVGRVNGKYQHTIEKTLRLSPTLDLYKDGPEKAEMDARRLNTELGAGGDILQDGRMRPYVMLPLKMDVVSAWLRLREKLLSGGVGGDSDGAADDEADSAKE